MRLRWYHGTILPLGLGAITVALHPSIYWQVHGQLHGEAFYEGRPTSAWAGLAHSLEPLVLGSALSIPPRIELFEDSLYFSHVRSRWPPRSPNVLESGLVQVGITKKKPALIESPLLTGDPDAFPVLLELLHNEDPLVRRMACSGIAAQRPGGRETVARILREAARDPDRDVRLEAAGGLRWADNKAAMQIWANEGVEIP